MQVPTRHRPFTSPAEARGDGLQPTLRPVTDAPAPASEPATQGSRAILLPVWATVFAGMLWLTSIRPFVRTIADELDTSVSLVGQIIGLAMLSMAIVGLFSGPLAEHYGYRRSIVTGLGLMALSALMISLAPGYPVALASGLVAGTGAALSYGVAFGVVLKHIPDVQRRSALGYTQAASSSATVIAPPLLAGIAAITLWRGAFGAAAVFITCAAVFALRQLPEDPPIAGHRDSLLSILHSYRAIFAAAGMVRLYGAGIVRSILALALPGYLGAFYADKFGFSLQAIGIVAMIEGAGLVAGNLFAGNYLRNRDNRTVFAVSTLAIGLGWIAVFSAQLDPLLTVALTTTLNFLAGVTFTVHTHLVAQQSPCGPATTMVLNLAMIGFGVGLGSLYGGLIIQAGGYGLLGIAALPFALTAAYLVWNGDVKSLQAPGAPRGLHTGG